MSLIVTVYGNPAPQGSKRHVGNGVMVESSKAVKPWREAVKHALVGLRESRQSDPWTPIQGPVAVELVFTVAKPASAPKRTRTWPARRPDLDKLIRSTLDAITDSGAIRDDAQVVELTAAKRYPGEGEHALTTPGAWIRITEVTA
jgi:Holliday junction resolvase RusA-like endonuclease